MSVDVEDYFQVQAFERHIERADWDRMPARVERNTERVLALFEAHRTHATFFVLGWIAERYPRLVRRIADAGHEVASHGYEHTRVGRQSAGEFARDVGRTKKLLEDLTGHAVKGFRAASFSIDAGTLWALDVLEQAGYVYSSSIYPVRHDLYGMPEASRTPFRPRGGGLLEIPLTTLPLFGRNLPCAGGGYFRLFPYAFSRWALARINREEGRSAVFYFHPWELDPNQPRLLDLDLKTRFRHYCNLERMAGRLARLLADFRWGRMDRLFLDGKVVSDTTFPPAGPSRRHPAYRESGV